MQDVRIGCVIHAWGTWQSGVLYRQFPSVAHPLQNATAGLSTK